MGINLTILVTLLIYLLTVVVSTLYKDISQERELVKQGSPPLSALHYVNIVVLGITLAIGYVLGWLITTFSIGETTNFWLIILIIVIQLLMGTIVKAIYIAIKAVYKFVKQTNGQG